VKATLLVGLLFLSVAAVAQAADIVIPAGTTRTGLSVTLANSDKVVLGAGATLKHSKIKCATTHSGPAIVAAGDPLDFAPRWRTACQDDTFQGGHCDFSSPQLALAAMAPGDRLAVDVEEWPALVVAVPDVVVLGCGNNPLMPCAMKGAYGYQNHLKSLTVTAPGVHVQNSHVKGATDVEPDTELVLVD
jgi:hypothetical protein